MAMGCCKSVMGARFIDTERVAPGVYNMDENWSCAWLDQYSNYSRRFILYDDIADGIDYAAVR